MSATATRIARVEVELDFSEIRPGAKFVEKRTAIVTEAEATNLMYALAESLGYDAVKRA